MNWKNLNYSKKGIIVGFILGFIIFCLTTLGIPVAIGLAFRIFLKNIFLLNPLDLLLENYFLVIYHFIYNSDTWIILFPLFFLSMTGLVYGYIIGSIIEKIKSKK